MSSKPKPSGSSGNITVGDINYATGVAIGHGAQANVTQSSGAMNDELARAFAALIEKVNALPDGPDKSAAESAVKGLQAEAEKGEKADESAVRKWFGFLAGTAKDVFDVAVDTFVHPIKGLSTVFQKVAARAKEERK